MLDEKEFLSPYGIRALSRYHLEHPYVFNVNGTEYRWLSAGRFRLRHVRRKLQLAGTDLDADQRAGRSRSLSFYGYFGNSFQVECPRAPVGK